MEGGDVLEAGGEFETGVEVDADALLVVEGAEALGVVGADAAAEQEGCVAVVGREDAPVELLAVATDGRAFRVEKEVIDEAGVGGNLLQIGDGGDVEGLDEAGSGYCLQLTDVVGGFRAVELDVVEGVVVGNTLDRLDGFIDEDADALASRGEVGGASGNVTARLRPEDEAHQADA